MELKLFQVILGIECKRPLIVPYGIETKCFTPFIDLNLCPLIEPYGIEKK